MFKLTTNPPRTLDFLHLRHANNRQGGHELLHLPTNKVINCRHLIRVPISNSVIEQVHDLALKDKMPKGLNIENKTGLLLYDSAWTVVVDYEEDDDSEDEDE